MQRHEDAIEIARPPEEVFAWLHEPERRLQWVDGLRASEPLGERRYRETVEQAGQRIQATSEIVRFEPPAALEIRSAAKGVTGTLRFRLAPAGEGTRVDVTVETAGSGFMGRIAEGLVAGHLQRSMGTSLRTLKRLLETP